MKNISVKNTNDKALNPTVVKLGVVSFFTDVASEMLYPITPIFLTTVLGASMASLGLIEGLADAVASILKVYSGSWSDRIAKRKPFILAGYILATVTKPFIALSQTWAHVLLARALDRVGKGLRSAPRDALIADSVTVSNRGAAFGWHRGMDTLGAAVGPLLALFFLSIYSGDLRSIYYWALIPGLISVLIVLTLKEPAPLLSQSEKWKNPLHTWKDSNKNFKSYIYAWGVFSLTNFSDVFLLMKAKSSGLSLQTVILLYCGYNLVYSLLSPYLGKLSDRIGRRNILISGLLVFILVYLGFSRATELWQYSLLFLIYGLYMAATDGIGKALAIDLCLNSLKGTAVGILGTVTGGCTVFASLFAGIIWDQFGASWTFVYGAIGACLAITMLLKTEITKKIYP